MDTFENGPCREVPIRLVGSLAFSVALAVIAAAFALAFGECSGVVLINPTIDAGVLPADQPVEIKTKIRNRNNRPVRVLIGNAYCGSRFASGEEMNIPPRSIGFVRLIWTPRGKPGAFARSGGTVLTDDPTAPRLDVSVRCRIEGLSYEDWRSTAYMFRNKTFR